MANFNEMTPFTRGMMAVSAVLFVVGVLSILSGYTKDAIVFWIPALVYWGYRFVKDGTNIK